MVPRNVPGSQEMTSVIQPYLQPSMNHHMEEDGRHNVRVRGPLEWAVGEGVMSQMSQVLPPPSHSEHLPLNSNQ